MPKNDIARKRRRRFRAALAACEMTETAWAKSNGISQGHLSQVLSGKRESPPLEAKIEQFALEYEQTLTRMGA